MPGCLMARLDSANLVEPRRIGQPKNMYYVYILKSKNFNKGYTGFTENIEKRLKEHNSGKNFYSKRYRPWIIVHQEKFGNKIDAINKERFYKSRTGKRRLKEIFNNYCPVV